MKWYSVKIMYTTEASACVEAESEYDALDKALAGHYYELHDHEFIEVIDAYDVNLDED